MPNRLATETSPYLLQHRDNPVDWYPWGPEALAKAAELDRPILLSIGYSSCHWCHVMAHESFEDPAIAGQMNRDFINIKVDREERPDIDSLYMTALQAMTGQGGWPLNIFLTPEGVPFFGGTYFPPEARQGMPGFPQVLDAVSSAWTEQREGITDNADQIRGFLAAASAQSPAPGAISPAILDTAFVTLAKQFDPVNGGFGSAPKFPQASLLEVLLRHARRTRDPRATEMLRLTLDRMMDGGIHDQLGGGFHRYSVDAEWLVPHFEKMLYDNAQLARTYLDAWRSTGDDRYAQVASSTIDYVLREMTTTGGAFASTQDADTEGGEGRFFTWTPEELVAVLGDEDAVIAAAYWDITPRGNFEGRSIPWRPRPVAEVAATLGISQAELETAITRIRPRLLAARDGRVHPGRDDKTLVGWNGMMIRPVAEAGRALGRPDYLDAARAAAGQVLDNLRPVDGLLHMEGKVPAFLEDYANLADGLVSLYEATFEDRWLVAALDLAEEMLARFGDAASPLLWDTSDRHETLISRPRDLQDGATPCGNSVAASVLVRLAILAGRADFRTRAGEMLAAMADPMAEQSAGFGRWLAALDSWLAMPREVVIAGPADAAATAEMARAVAVRYDPNSVLALAPDGAPNPLLPITVERPMREGAATAYVCEAYSCLPPATDPADLAVRLEIGSGVTWQEF